MLIFRMQYDQQLRGVRLTCGAGSIAFFNPPSLGLRNSDT